MKTHKRTVIPTPFYPKESYFFHTPRRMPKKRNIFSFFLIIVSLTFLFVIPARAAPSLVTVTSEDDPGTEASDLSAWVGWFNSLIPDRIADKVSFSDPASASSLVGLPWIFSQISEGVFGFLPSFTSLFCTLFGLSLLGGLICEWGEEEKSDGIPGRVVVMVTALTLYRLVEGSFERALSALSDMRSFTVALLPLTTALYEAGGNVSASVAQASTVGLSLTVSEFLLSDVLSPLLSGLLSLFLIGAIGGNERVRALSGSLRKLYVIVLGLVTTVFSASLALQTILGTSADSVGARVARYTVSELIPGVGSTVGGTLPTFAASVSLARNTVGIGGIAVLICLFIPPLLELGGVTAALSLAGSFSEMMGFSGAGRLYRECKGIFEMLLGCVALSAAGLGVMLTVFLKSGVAIA